MGTSREPGEGVGPDVEVGVHDVELVAAARRARPTSAGAGAGRGSTSSSRLNRVRSGSPYASSTAVRLRRLGREQGHLVPLRHQTVAQGGDDPLGPAVRARRDGLVERGDLRDPHDVARGPDVRRPRRWPLGPVRAAHPTGNEVSHAGAVVRWQVGHCRFAGRPRPTI